uniref:LamG-like jellyroll fold domain-containing protein n=1 Tax=Cryptomonas curvata TaxID=233186 RepID=A0A7S0QMR9_9CRYP|mmetsp:Transcript_36984/g.77263  ORF Transcript_36984/g.77263 Transcript_36984/m.77263 type:complete len:360 (+) Transcript_36984:42-1121(+)
MAAINGPKVCFLAVLSLVFVSESLAQRVIFALKFDEGQGANVFTDSSGFGQDANCRMSGASCPRTGVTGKHSYSAFFAASCPRSYGSSVDGCDYAGRQPNMNNLSPGQRTDCYFSKTKILEFSRQLASLASMCGSAVAFNPITFNDGTVMMWYKEFGANDGNPQQLFNPLVNRAVNPSDSSVMRSPADFGFDLSLVGGSDFFLGRIGSSHWGGYWCGRWHVARPGGGVGPGMSPGYGSGDPRRGWDHLAWHHLAYVFAGDSVLVYLDGAMVVMMTGVGSCSKQASFVGKRSVRYDGQGGVREIEAAGYSRDPSPPAGAGPDSLRTKEWGTNYFKGYLDDLRIYDAPLDHAAIAAAMNSA